jgi:5-methylcytosine-specific restriction endonuclease McrA
MASKNYTVEDVKNAILNNKSWRKVCETIGLRPAGGNMNTIKRIAIKNGFDTSHFLGQGWNRGSIAVNAIPTNEYFIKGVDRSLSNLREKVIKNKLIEYKCQKCGLINIWNSDKLVLQLDHINGDKRDSRIENLRFLCPNCHSQTKNYCGRKNLIGKNSINKSICINCGKKINNNKIGRCRACWETKKVNLIDFGMNREILIERLKNVSFKRICSEIGVNYKILKRICREEHILIPNLRSKINESKQMAIERSRKFHISKEELVKLVESKPMTSIGKMFNISDNAVRKRCRLMGIQWKKENIV